MRKYIAASMMLAALIAATSCVNEIVEPDVQNDEPARLTLSAIAEEIDQATKAEMSYKFDILWNEGDKIVARQLSNLRIIDRFTLSEGAGTNRGTFSQDGTRSFSGEVQFIYPSTIINDGGSLPIWPTVQTRDQVMPMSSTKLLTDAHNEELAFSSLGAVLQIAFSTSSKNVKLRSIEIKDGSKTMSGGFNIEDGAVSFLDNTHRGVTLDLGTGVTMGVSAKYFNLMLPSGKYDDVTLTFTAFDGRTCVMRSRTMPELKRNTINRLTLSGVFNDNGVQLWEGGPIWAPVNIGATKPEEAGCHFSWGNVTGYVHSSSGTWVVGPIFSNAGEEYSEGFSESSYNASRGNNLMSTQDIPDNAEYDAARAIWGGDWRIPSRTELETLINANGTDKTNMTWTAQNGVKGLLVSGVGDYSGNSIFLPATGFGSDVSIVMPTSQGFYWSSSHDESSDKAYTIVARSVSNSASEARSLGLAIRPVRTAPVVSVIGVNLDKSTCNLNVNGSIQLNASVYPENATDKAVTWSSDDPAIASVSQNGLVTGLKVGTTNIIVTTEDGEKNSVCKIHVKGPSPLPQNLVARLGELFSGSIITDIEFVANDVDERPGEVILTDSDGESYASISRGTVTIRTWRSKFKAPSYCSQWLCFTNLKSVTGLENVDFSATTNMSFMFYGCSSLTSLDLSTVNTPNLANVSFMFYNCKNLATIDGFSNFIGSSNNLKDMEYMFGNCTSLTSLDFGNYCRTTDVTTMTGMFDNCSGLWYLNISSFSSDKLTSVAYMFRNAMQGKVNPMYYATIHIGNSFFCNSVVSTTDAFLNFGRYNGYYSNANFHVYMYVPKNDVYYFFRTNIINQNSELASDRNKGYNDNYIWFGDAAQYFNGAFIRHD